ncbi:hypothetical protein IMZ11_12105 [Microtetraspora sp. AC03309]|uniref:hypothetical protein n=1 Tax=Microtetraspora sp. AC03309 TaxID=2779376 RepID=UPI001E542313|nr:hypothetical protein [Microtetraspora sp. AC03309]MCC5576375.1 hypothetical protein [Microtetraspora sp. AC03309]
MTRDADAPDGAAGDVPRGRALRALKKPAVWLVGTMGAALASIIGGIVLGVWPWLQDMWADHQDRPRITAIAYSPVEEGDAFAFRDAITGGPRRILQGDPDETKLVDFIRRERGARIGSMNVTLVLRGERRDTIRIVDVRPRVRKSMPNASGTCFVMPNAGSADVFAIVADLDALAPGGTAKRGARFLKKNIDLAYGERATVEITAEAARRAYEWDVQIDYVYGDDLTVQHAYVTDRDGQPFRITGEARTYRVAYDQRGLTSVFRVAKRNRSC